ncbi:SMI1/KNR4 family protein [Paenibacillus sp. SYP-B3998]|uniref:SMI1/KNR4 family protein n=1 Tax=Paenibacillus sp. SYP-B3998 TaxID=2678564 RepID=A0A6G4A4K0_9BACL|nr:SMI1/KNR4 family protein [Paenibacillus sp. SYP-B3998]NEW09393.1 SMI1/KNR4 family protein [Paenibacillus sp. SYP-B3998]
MRREQLYRIRRKLEQAAKADPECSVFGSRAHKYKLNEPLSLAELRRFEQAHGIALPESYASFVTELGNGGAGPYYGIHPLGAKQAIDLDLIGQPSPLRPGDKLELSGTSEGGLDENSEDDEDEKYPGLLNIGEQGCTYETMLMITGDYRGKVIYVDLDSLKTFFTYEENFLDWYERWLDETIAGYDSAWFGLRRGGDDRELMELYRSAAEESIKIEALEGMLKLPDIGDETVGFLLRHYHESSSEVCRWALQVLAKMRFGQAEPLIRQKLRSQDAADRLLALQFIKWYMPEGDRSFTEELAAMLPLETDEEAFLFLAMILSEAGVDMLLIMLPFFSYPNKNIRIQALYQAGKSPAPVKADYVSKFIEALEDTEARVQLIALQALRGVTDARLLEVFERLLQQHKTDKDYIRTNVRGLLEEFPFRSLEQVEREVPSSLRQVKGMLRKLMEPYLKPRK